MSEPVRLYRHYSAAQLDSAFVRISLKIRAHDKGWQRLTEEKVGALERLRVVVDEERAHRLPPIKE